MTMKELNLGGFLGSGGDCRASLSSGEMLGQQVADGELASMFDK